MVTLIPPECHQRPKSQVVVGLREFISEQECTAYHSGKAPKLGQAKHMFSTRIKLEINMKLWRYQNDGDIGTFERYCVRQMETPVMKH